MAIGILVLLFLGLLVVGLVALIVMGIVMIARGRMSGLALLLVGIVASIATFFATAYLTFVEAQKDARTRAGNVAANVMASDASHSSDGSYVEISPGRQSDPNEIASLEPTPSPGLGQVVIPPGRPEWVEAPPREEDNTLFVSVNSGPYVTGLESRRALDEQLLEATEAYIREVLERPDATTYVDFSSREIRNYLVAEEYSEIIEVSIGPMHQSHARLKFDETFVSQLKERWQQAVVASRLAATSLFFVSAIAVLGAVYFFLRLDTATRGYYTGRLQLGAGVAILGIVVAGVLAARWIPWL